MRRVRALLAVLIPLAAARSAPGSLPQVPFPDVSAPYSGPVPKTAMIGSRRR
jgi:hypothetical protein